MARLRWVPADGHRDAGWWDGDPWTDPIPVGPHLRHQEADRLLIRSAPGRRTRPEGCPRCRGRIVDYQNGGWRCTRRPEDGGCGRADYPAATLCAEDR